MSNKTIFLDRDGVINYEVNYLHKISDFKFINGTFDACQSFLKLGYKIIIITNQAGIGKGLYSNDDFQKLTKHMKDLFLRHDCHIDAVYHCPFHPTEGVGIYLNDSYDRKPNPGMLLKAQKDFNLDMNKSIFIGDKISDIVAGNNALVKTNILFNKNKNKKSHNYIEINCLIEALKYL